MSVQFGTWNFEGQSVDHDYLDRVSSILKPYGPDGNFRYTRRGVLLLYQAFHTNTEARHEIQPHLTETGQVIMWDGRLDNRSELIRSLPDTLTAYSPDVAIVAAAYERWGASCFRQLVGDWAVSIWNPTDRSILLAKDFAGIRPLYYHVGSKRVVWCSILDPLVLLSENRLQLNEEYLAGWFSFFPRADLTPYAEIHSVPPGAFVSVRNNKATIEKYWQFNSGKRIRYGSDREYEEHFRAVFEESVRRRLRSDRPVLSELSGGMDSSSIVCVADVILAAGRAETPRLDTLSYYSEEEPNWNERPYFTKVEEKRGRTGCHIDVGSQESLIPEYERGHFPAKPGSGRKTSKTGGAFAECLAAQGNCVLLSGIGGDEMLGGVPTPTPELADLLAGVRLRSLGHQLLLWGLAKRKPILYLLFDTVRAFLPVSVVGVQKHKRPAFWLNPKFVARNRAALTGYESRLKFFGPLPTFQENLSTLEVLQRQLACSTMPKNPAYEKRYPFLDRDLLEFLYAIPREQLVRPHQRRSLMRRALVGIVPDELLNRKRKAFVARGPMVGISAEWPRLSELTEHMVSETAGIVDPLSFRSALDKIRQGQEVPIVPIMRTISIECWLRAVSDCNYVNVATVQSWQRTGPQPQPAGV